MTENGKGQTRVFMAAAAATLVVVAIVSLLMKSDAAIPEAPAIPVSTLASNRIEEESIFLYFTDQGGRFLTSEDRTISTAKDPWQLSRKIIHSLIEGPESGHTRTLPPTTRLRAIYMTDPKVAVVDFSQEVRGIPQGTSAECLAIYSVVNSLAVNIPEIDAVHILIEGNPAETLSGHIDISEPLKPDMHLVR